MSEAGIIQTLFCTKLFLKESKRGKPPFIQLSNTQIYMKNLYPYNMSDEIVILKNCKT